MKTVIRFFMVLGVLVFPANLIAQEISVHTYLDSSEYLIGDYVNLRIEASHNKEVELTWPPLESILPSLEFITKTPIDTSQTGDLLVETQVLTYIVFDSGHHVVPSIPLRLHVRGDTNNFEIHTDSIPFYVFSPQVDTTSGIMPIKGPLDISAKRKTWWIYLLLGVLVLAYIIVHFVLRKRRKEAKATEVIKYISPKSAYKTAIEKLNKLNEEKLWQQEQIKPYYIRLSDIVREYVEHRFKFLALESTTDEIMEDLQKVLYDEENTNNLKYVLELSDFVKFAKAKPLSDEHAKCMTYAYGFIRGTKPSEETVVDENLRGKDKQNTKKKNL
jgi:hypothetical protein